MLRESEATFEEDFAGRVLVFDELAAHKFASIMAARRSQVRPMGVADGQIAAIARSRGAVLATRNTHDFEGCGVRLVNPWEA